jgi:hypothetical protein
MSAVRSRRRPPLERYPASEHGRVRADDRDPLAPVPAAINFATIAALVSHARRCAQRVSRTVSLCSAGRSAIVRAMRACLVALAVLGVIASSVRADQRQDWMLDTSPEGEFLLLDYFGTGAQLGFEHRRKIYGGANGYRLNATAVLSYPLGQVSATAAVRVLFLELSGSVGYRSVWRNLSFEPGDDGEYCKACDRKARRDRDPVLGHGPDTDRFPFAEGTAQLYAPLNEWVVFASSLTARYEGLRERSYDWFYTNIHDDGVMLISETLLFLKHRDWGGFAPYWQVMSLPRAGEHETEVAFGFNAVTRLGLLARNDLLFATFLIRPSDGYYGQHAYFSPVRALLIYRMQLEL